MKTIKIRRKAFNNEQSPCHIVPTKENMSQLKRIKKNCLNYAANNKQKQIWYAANQQLSTGSLLGKVHIECDGIKHVIKTNCK